MVQVIGIPANVKTFANLFLALKDTDWVKVQRKLGTINVRKINNSFQFIDDLLSLNEGSTFEKHFKDIYPADVELKKNNNSNLVLLFLIFTLTLKMENFILDYFTSEITLASIS